MRQLSFLPEIDPDKTKEKVEEALEEYRIALWMEPEERLPKVTQSFTLVPPSNTNGFHSSTEDAAIANVDEEIRRQNHIKKVQRAVNRLGFKERELIIKRYMGEEELFDYEVYNDIGMSETKYYKVRASAFYKLALNMRLDVFVECEEVLEAE